MIVVFVTAFVHFGQLELLVISRAGRTVRLFTVVGCAGVSLGTCVALYDFKFLPFGLKLVAQAFRDFLVGCVSRFEWIVFHNFLVGLDLFLTFEDHSSTGLVVDFLRSRFVAFEEFSQIFVGDDFFIHVDESWERGFPPVHEEVRRHLAVGSRSRIIRPFDVLEMVDPRFAVLVETFAKVSDESAIEPLDVSLRLGTIRDASSLRCALDFAHALQQLGRELVTVIRGQQTRRADEASEIFERAAYPDGVLRLELVEFDVAGEHINENQNVLKAASGNRKLQ